MGAITTTGLYKVSGPFVAVGTKVYTSDEETEELTSELKWYSAELGGWLANGGVEKNAVPASEGERSNVVNGASFYSTNACSGTATGTVTNADLYQLNITTQGGGTAVLSGITLYGGHYVVSGGSGTITLTANSGYKIWKATKNGNAESTTNSTISTGSITGDTQYVVWFSKVSFNLTLGAPTGGTVAVTKNGAAVNANTTVGAGDVVVCAATAASGYTTEYTRIGGTYGNNSVTLTIPESINDVEYLATAKFNATQTLENTIEVGANGSVVITDSDDNSVDIDDEGKFTVASGRAYTITATAANGYKVEGIYIGSTKVSAVGIYNFMQGLAEIAFRVVFVAKQAITVSLKCGNTTAATESTWEGCSCAKSNNGDVYTFTPTTASGKEFVELYIEDLDGTGQGSVKTLPSGAASIGVTITFNARVVAVFRVAGGGGEPGDENQGNATNGNFAVSVWEGGTANKAAVWKSRRIELKKPCSFSAGHVYADAYGIDGNAHDVELDIGTFQSPQQADGSERVMIIGSQKAFRIPADRPEKYVELTLKTKVQVTEIAIGTSMEALWQNTVM